MSNPTQERISRPMIPASELERLSSVMGREGFSGKPSVLLTALLNRFEEQQQGGADQEATSTVQWFTNQIDALQAQLSERNQQVSHLTDQLARQSANQQARQPSEAPRPSAAPAAPRGGNSRAKVDSIIDALITWNTAQDDRL